MSTSLAAPNYVAPGRHDCSQCTVPVDSEAYCTNRLAYQTVKRFTGGSIWENVTLLLSCNGRQPHEGYYQPYCKRSTRSDGLLQGMTQLFSESLLFMLSSSQSSLCWFVFIRRFSLFVAWFIFRLSHRMFVEQQAAQGRNLSGYVEEMVSGQKIVKTFCSDEERAEACFPGEMNARLYRCGVKPSFIHPCQPVYSFCQWNCLHGGSDRLVRSVLVTGFPAVLSIGQITSFLAMPTNIQSHSAVTGVITQIQTAFASARATIWVFGSGGNTDVRGCVRTRDAKGNVRR